MEQGNQPTGSAQPQPQPIVQPPFGDGNGAVQMQPKKSKKGLIIGIVTGSLLLIALVAGLLTYFLWWQNPQKMVTDAVANTITTQKATVSGNVVVEVKDAGFKLDMSIKSANDIDKSKTDISAKMMFGQSSESINLNLKGNVIVSGKDIYLKADNLKSSIADAYKAYNKFMAEILGYSMTDSEINQKVADDLRPFNPTISKLDGKWLKVSLDDITDKKSRCVANELSELNKNNNFKREIAKVYQENQFLVVQDAKVGDRNGGRGFEVHGSKDKLKSFIKSVENTEFGKKVKDCDSKAFDRDALDNNDSGNSKLKLWVDSGHNLKAFELEGDSDGTKIKFSFDINPGKTENIEIPSNADNLKDVLGEFDEDSLKSMLSA